MRLKLNSQNLSVYFQIPYKGEQLYYKAHSKSSVRLSFYTATVYTCR